VTWRKTPCKTYAKMSNRNSAGRSSNFADFPVVPLELSEAAFLFALKKSSVLDRNSLAGASETDTSDGPQFRLKEY
jgi:hypothetical protein